MPDISNNEAEAARDPRVRMAAERTLLAWIRTGLALMGFGFVVARFGLFLREVATAEHRALPHSSTHSLWIGTALIVMGIAVTTVPAINHLRLVRRLTRGEMTQFSNWPLSVTVALMLAALGLVMTTYVVSVGR